METRSILKRTFLALIGIFALISCENENSIQEIQVTNPSDFARNDLVSIAFNSIDNSSNNIDKKSISLEKKLPVKK